jgi:hypothetical protein
MEEYGTQASAGMVYQKRFLRADAGTADGCPWFGLNAIRLTPATG